MKDLWRFIKSSGIYFVGTVLTKLITFLLLPLYTSYIKPADYGTYDLYNTYLSFLCSVLFLDIWAGIMRFMYDYTGEEKKKPISCGLVIFSSSCVIYTIILLTASQFMDVEYVPVLFLYGILMNLQTLVGYIARGYGKTVLYTAAGLVGSVVTILFNVLLLVYFHMDYSALFIASCIGYVVNIVMVVIGVRVPHAFSVRNFDRQLFKEMLIFSLPLCLNSVAYWFLTSYNKVALVGALGTEANGYYAIASRFGSMITLFTTCFQMAWQELSFSKSAREDDLGDFYTKAINSYIKTMGAGLAVLIPVIYIIYPIMINRSYDTGKELVPMFLLGTILSTISSFLGNTFSAIKRNQLLFYTMAIGSIANVISVHLLLPVFGIQATNIALIIGFLIICVSRVLFLKREMTLRTDFVSIVVLLFAFAVVTAAYSKGNMVMNMLAFVFAAAVSLFLFRDVIRMMIGQLRASRRS